MRGESIHSGPPARTGGRPLRADIQALRALAVVLVLAYHLWPQVVPGGYVGVDAFFVISGFLITGQLAQEAASGRVSLRNFWTRRARRLLPSSLLVLALAALATFAWTPRHAWDQSFREIAASALYVENWVLARDAVDYLASSDEPSIVQHYWTLSIEEQFYIGLPLLFALALRSRLRLSRLPLLLGAIALASLAYSISLTARNSALAYFVTTTRIWEFAAGGVLATAGWRAPRSVQRLAFWGGSALVLGAGLAFGEQTPFPGYHALVPVLGAALVIWAGAADGLAGRLVSLRPVQWTGDASYAIYLWHWPLAHFAPRWLGGEAPGLEIAVAAATLVLAGLTTRYLERPIRSGPIVAGTRRAVLLGSTAGAFVVLALAAIGLHSIHIRRAALAEIVGAARDADPNCFGAAAMLHRCPPATSIVPDVEMARFDQANRGDCWSNNNDSTLRICTLGPERSPQRRIFAVGDSHNNALIPAYSWMAETAGWRIDVAGKGGCYLTTAAIRQFEPQFRAECRKWLRQVRRHLRQSAPYDAILVTHREGWALLVDEASQFRAEVDGQVEAWSELAGSGSRIIAIRDVPQMPYDIVECVQRHGLRADEACSVPRGRALPLLDSQQEAVRRVAGARLVDLGDLYCTERCSPVIGGVAVYQSYGHFTMTFARSLAPYLLLELRDALE